MDKYSKTIETSLFIFTPRLPTLDCARVWECTLNVRADIFSKTGNYITCVLPFSGAVYQ